MKAFFDYLRKLRREAADLEAGFGADTPRDYGPGDWTEELPNGDLLTHHGNGDQTLLHQDGGYQHYTKGGSVRAVVPYIAMVIVGDISRVAAYRIEPSAQGCDHHIDFHGGGQAVLSYNRNGVCQQLRGRCLTYTWNDDNALCLLGSVDDRLPDGNHPAVRFVSELRLFSAD